MGDENTLELHLFYSNSNKINNVKFNFYTANDIPNEMVAKFRKLGGKMSMLRIENYKRQNGIKKVEKNGPCSCGSGKKYKRCHGK